MSSSVFATAVSKRVRQLQLHVSADELGKLETYYQLLVRWNQKTNLTSLPVESLSPESLDRILLEPLSAGADFPTGAVRWIDLGSGGGSPAVPLRILKRAATLTMVEVREKKAAFLREVVRTLALDRVAVAARRYEDLAADPDFIHQADVVTARAVRADAAFIEAVATLLRPAGHLLLFESADAPELPSDRLTLISRRLLLPGNNAQLSTYRVA